MGYRSAQGTVSLTLPFRISWSSYCCALPCPGFLLTQGSHPGLSCPHPRSHTTRCALLRAPSQAHTTPLLISSPTSTCPSHRVPSTGQPGVLGATFPPLPCLSQALSVCVSVSVSLCSPHLTGGHFAWTTFPSLENSCSFSLFPTLPNEPLSALTAILSQIL